MFMNYLMNISEGGAWACKSRARFKRLVFAGQLPCGSAAGRGREACPCIKIKSDFGKGA